MRNSKTCIFLAEKMGRCQMFLQLFRFEKTSPFWTVFARCLPNRKNHVPPIRFHNDASTHSPVPHGELRSAPSSPHGPKNGRKVLTRSRRARSNLFPQLFPSKRGDCPTPEPVSFFIYGGGMTKVWPTRKRRGSSLRLAAISASTLTLYCRAIKLSVSPALTV
jgi:hypothetical protein